jgi:hypothetical protein
MARLTSQPQIITNIPHVWAETLRRGWRVRYTRTLLPKGTYVGAQGAASGPVTDRARPHQASIPTL